MRALEERAESKAEEGYRVGAGAGHDSWPFSMSGIHAAILAVQGSGHGSMVAVKRTFEVCCFYSAFATVRRQ